MRDYEVKVLMNIYDKIKNANPRLGNESVKNIFENIVDKMIKDELVKSETANIVFQIYFINKFKPLNAPISKPIIRKETTQISSDSCSGGGINRRGGC